MITFVITDLLAPAVPPRSLVASSLCLRQRPARMGGLAKKLNDDDEDTDKSRPDVESVVVSELLLLLLFLDFKRFLSVAMLIIEMSLFVE